MFVLVNGDAPNLFCGGGFDFIGELVPYYMRLTNLFVHMSPELAGELSAFSIFGSTRIITRAVLHYPHTWLITQNAVERGARVGRESAPLYMMRYEEVFALTPDVARVALGIRGVEMMDTAAASAEWI